MEKQRIEISGEEFLCHTDTLTENVDGSITIEGRIFVYTNKGTYDKVVKVRLKNEKSGKN